MDEIVELVASHGPIGAREIGQRLPHTARKLVIAPGTRNETEIAAHTRVLQQAAFEGRLVRTRPQGTWVGSQYAWAAMDICTDIPIDALDTAEAEPEPDDHPGPWVALLPGLDPTAMGWKHRDWYLDDVTAARVTDRSGNIGPTVWADGRIVGGWAQRPDGSIATEVLHDLGLEHRRLLEVETGRLQEIVGPARFRARFPSPNQKDLLR